MVMTWVMIGLVFVIGFSLFMSENAHSAPGCAGILGILLMLCGGVGLLGATFESTDRMNAKVSQSYYTEIISDGWSVVSVIDEKSTPEDTFHWVPARNVYLVCRVINGNKIYGILSSDSPGALDMKVEIVDNNNPIVEALNVPKD